MKCIQLNLNHCEIAQDLLWQTIAERKIDVAILSEPYRISDGGTAASDATNKASIWACGRFPLQEVVARGEEGYVVARVNGVYIFSCYAPPSLQPDEFEQLLDKITTAANRFKPNIIAGDFNAWAVEWGSRYTNSRGEILLEMFARIDTVLMNAGDTSTFRRNGGSSIIDLTFASPVLARDIRWSVSEDFTNSDHQAIVFELNKWKIATHTGNHSRGRQRGWMAKAMDIDVIVEAMKDVNLPEGTAEEKAKIVSSKLEAACDASMPKRILNDRREPAY